MVLDGACTQGYALEALHPGLYAFRLLRRLVAFFFAGSSSFPVEDYGLALLLAGDFD
jgi:hypothetical protein